MSTAVYRLKGQVMDAIALLLGKKGALTIRDQLIKGASGAVGLNIAFFALSFVLSIFLTRMLGSEAYGLYAYVLGWISVLGIPAALVSNRLLTREVARYQTLNSWHLLAGLRRWAGRVNWIASLAVAAGTAAVLWFWGNSFSPELRTVFWIALWLVPIQAVLRVNQGIIQGLNRVVAGHYPDLLVQPLAFLLLLVGAALLTAGWLDAGRAMMFHISSAALGLVVSAWLLARYFPREGKAVAPRTESRVWWGSSASLLFISAMFIINSRTDILMLGWMKGAVEVGIYSVANRGGELVAFILAPATVALGPTIAALFAENDRKQLQKIMAVSSQVLFLLTLPVALIFIFFGRYFLLIFGVEFTPGAAALAILSGAQLVSVMLGPATTLLIMTTHDRFAALGIVFSAILNVLLNLFFIPRWGVEGAALATATSLVLRNLLIVLIAYRVLGILAVPFGHRLTGGRAAQST